MRKVNKNSTSKKILITLTILATLGMVAGGFLVFGRKNHNQSQANTTAPSSVESKINLDPPTTQEKQAAEDKKQQIITEQNATPSSTANVPIVITDASQYGPTIEVRAYVPDIYEKDGTCTFSFTKNTDKIVKTTSAQPDAKTTYCTTLSVPRSEFSGSGDWQLTITYKSSTHSGTTTSKLRIE